RDFNDDMNSIADQHGLAELPIQFPKGQDRPFNDACLHGQTTGNGEDQQPVRNPLAEELPGRIFRISVNLVKVTRQAGKAHNVAFGDGPPGRHHTLAHFKLFKIPAARPVACIFHRLSSSFSVSLDHARAGTSSSNAASRVAWSATVSRSMKGSRSPSITAGKL